MLDEFGFIYFIQAGDRGRIKIGFTVNNPAIRLRQLQAGSSELLNLVGLRYGTIEGEGDIHVRFGHLRSHREWFEPTRELIDYIHAEATGRATPDIVLRKAEIGEQYAESGNEPEPFRIGLVKDSEPGSLPMPRYQWWIYQGNRPIQGPGSVKSLAQWFRETYPGKHLVGYHGHFRKRVAGRIHYQQ